MDSERRYSSWVLERTAIGDVIRLRLGVSTIGRHPSSIIRILESSYVSRNHAQLEISEDDERVEIRDLNSVNGIFINNTLYRQESLQLSAGDQIGIGVCISMDENDVDLDNPIYVLKNVPLRRASNKSAANAAKPPTSQAPEPVSADKPTTSKAANATTANAILRQEVNPGKQEASPAVFFPADIVITLSDDDEINIGAKSKPQPKTASNVVFVGTDLDLPKITSVVGNVINENELHFTKATSNYIDISETAANSSKTSCQFDQPSKSTTGFLSHSSTAVIIISKDAPATESSVHIPLISSVKKELVRSVSADIKSIFGETDEVILDKIKEINPYVYNDLNGKPMQMIGTSKKPLLNGDYITLSSDEDDEEPSIGNIAMPRNEEKGTAEQGHRSPNIFDTSLNDSKEYATEEQQPQISEISGKEIGHPSKLDVRRDSTYNIQNTVGDDQTKDEDMEELMFSQVIINEMKEELALNNDIENYDFEKNENNLVIMPIAKIKPDPEVSTLFAKTASALTAGEKTHKEQDSVQWLISDEEDFDEELETKVTGWSTKLFSQSFSLANMSQVYDLEVGDEQEHDDDAGEKYDVNEGDDAVDDNDFYNSDANRIIDEMFLSLKDKLEQAATNEIEDKQDRMNELKTSEKEKHQHLVSGNEALIFTPNCQSPLIRNDLPSSSEEDELKQTKRPNEELNNKLKRHKENKLQITDDSRHSSKGDVKRDPEGRTSSVSKDETATRSAKTPADNPIVSEKCEENQKIKAAEPVTKHSKPPVIDAPHMPKTKGKCRGVSASPAYPSTQAKNLTKKVGAIRETFRHEMNINDLKRKWHEKPSAIKRREKEKSKSIKESRKERLKELAEKKHQPEVSDGTKRKLALEIEDRVIKKPKVKVTPVNRGAFLTENNQTAATKQFKIPKIQKNDINDESNVSKHERRILVSKPQTTTASGKEESAECKANTSPNNYRETFSQIISKPDELLLNQQHSKETNCKPNKSTVIIACSKESALTSARAQRTTNKITFASMQKNFIESHQNQKKLQSISNQRSCLLSTENESTEKKKKKTVRFNETPVVYYIERVFGARKKVDQKDLMPRPWFNDRRHMVRSVFPILDCTDKVISLILAWSNEWLIKRNAGAGAAADEIYPMPQTFSSFDHYKSIIFPLMKLEFVSMLEREYTNSKVNPVKILLEHATGNKDRLLLIAKYNSQNKSNLNALKCDLVILDFGSSCAPTFAYTSAHRKGVGSWDTAALEILPTNVSTALLSTIKEIIVRPVVDNVRVEFGAFQAVYQLQETPLFSKILDPMELLKCKPPPKRKIAYKGFDKVNDEQRQILLGTYIKVIDETTPNITLIQGPPGTGKSRLISNLALQSLYGEEVHCMDKKILICAQSNGAVDVLAEKLYRISLKMRPEVMFRIVRFGILEKINPNVAAISLQKLLERDQLKRLKARNPDIQTANKQHLQNQMVQLAAEIDDMQTHYIKGTVQEDELLEKQRQLQLMRNIATQTMRPEDEHSIFTWYLTNANIVCATLSSCVKLSQYINYFDICIIDEATQCTEPWTLVPLKFGINSLVLVGDTQQLPATVLSKKASDFGLGTSMFTRIQRCLNQANLGRKENGLICNMRMQYRMHPEICKWPNAYFYKSELTNAPITEQYKSALVPFSILNLAYSQDEHCSNGKIVNNLEADFVAKLLKALDSFVPSKYNSYGVITPYAHHRDTLYATIKAAGLTNIMVNTIDSYQGIEKDVIIISNARTSGIGFLSNYQRLNVALTRPKKCLILCGNFKSLESVPAWRNLLNNARERKLFHDISAASVEDVHRNVIDKIKVKR